LTESVKITVFATYTLSAIEACFKNRRFPEMMHAGSIYEDQIETFQEAWKQRIDSNYSNHRGSLFIGQALLYWANEDMSSQEVSKYVG
jgi:hypothetical protein